MARPHDREKTMGIKEPWHDAAASHVHWLRIEKRAPCSSLSQSHAANHRLRVTGRKLVTMDCDTSLLDLDKIWLDEFVM
jgi:hypothetical protein